MGIKDMDMKAIKESVAEKLKKADAKKGEAGAAKIASEAKDSGAVGGEGGGGAF